MVVFIFLLFIIMFAALILRVAVGLLSWAFLLFIFIVIANIINRDKEDDSETTKALKHSYRVIGTGLAFLGPGLVRCYQTKDYYTAWNGSVVLNGPDYLSLFTVIIGVIILFVGIITFLMAMKNR